MLIRRPCSLGVIASVICVAGAGFRLSLILNAVGCQIASAGLEIHSISKGVTLFSLMLKQVGQALQAPDSVHSAEALETAQEITNECRLVFDEIQEMLDKVTTQKGDGSLAPSIQQRFRWCFKKGRVQYLLAQLESLKMSLVVMLQILQLGKMMAMTPKRYVSLVESLFRNSPVEGSWLTVRNSEQREDIVPKSDMIADERAQTQNVIIVRYWQINRLDRLFAAAEHEEADERKIQIEQKDAGTADKPQLVIEAPPEYTTSTALIKLPIVTFGELDATLSHIRESPRDMLRVSESVIDPLLERWTRWQEIRDQHEARPGRRYAPYVQNVHEPDAERSRSYSDFHDREDSPGGYYIEGATTDWRKPHSAAAKQEAAKLRKKYAGLQPSISVESSDAEDDRRASQPKKHSPSRHVIESSSETSDSEADLPHRRRKSHTESSTDKRPHYQPRRPSGSHSYGNGGDPRGDFGGRHGSSPNGTPLSTPRSSVSAPRSPGAHRPIVNPVQNQYHHSYTTPLPSVNTAVVAHPYAPHSPYSPNPSLSLHPPPYQGYTNSQHYPPRHMATPGHRMPMTPQQRPVSRDKHPPRSPSRHSGHSVHSQRSIEDMKKAERSRKHKNMAKGATKGILGTGAIAGFLEALEGLEL